MSKIAGLLETMDFSVLVPKLNTVLGFAQFLAMLAVLIGPLVMLVLGLLYFFKPTPEANHKMGFRTYFGMGSVEAWQFTQRVAGIVFGGLGAILTIVMVIVCACWGGKDLPQIVNAALKCMLWEAGLAFAGWLFITLWVTIRFDAHGNRRK
jgi:hypothetical protein